VTSVSDEAEYAGDYTVVGDEFVLSTNVWAGVPSNPYCRVGDTLTVWSGEYESDLTDIPCTEHAECEHLSSDPPDDVFGYCERFSLPSAAP
jgi:hypothetical protein